jgi:RNA polymerase sigma factor (sigma-70 family)
MAFSNNAEFFDADFYKKSLRFCISYVGKSGGNKNDALDVLQDSIERLLSKINDKNFKFEHDPSHLLYGIIKNTWKEYRVHKKLVLNEKFLSKDTVDDSPVNIEKKLKMEMHYDIFYRCLKKLSPSCIKAINLHKKGTEIKEMMAKLNLKTRGVVDDKVSRCKKKLRLIMYEDNEFIELLKDE